MAIAEMMSTLDDEALLTLRSNAVRLSDGPPGPRQKEALLLLPLIEVELAGRPLPARKRPKAKAAVAETA
jgi:hypothetical protein